MYDCLCEAMQRNDMPQQQVYGKRARAIYDPFAVFASPQRGSGDLQEVKIPEVAKEFAKLRAQDGREGQNEYCGRRALGEKNMNEVMLLANPPRAVAKTKRRIARKLVVEEGAEEVETDSRSPSTIHATRRVESETNQQSENTEQGRAQSCDEDDQIDNVALFCDSHGYDTEDEDQAPAASAVDQQLRDQQLRDHTVHDQLQPSLPPPTPSISIHPPTPPAPDAHTEHCSGLLSLSSHSMSMFSEWSNQLSSHFTITKIAEASFGEVYRLSLLEQISGFSASDESVFKIIALRPPNSTLPLEKRRRDAILKRTENMSKPEDVTNEVRLLQRMSVIPGFTNFRDVRVIKGRPPFSFAKAYKAYNAAQKARKKDLSSFADPAKKASYPDDQLWAVIEMQDAGTDLENLVENGQCSSIWFIWDVFWQVVLSLAKGEEGAEFEHRDLHLGNICVRQSSAPLVAIDTKRKLNFTGLETTIIDYTISRAVMANDNIAYYNLAKDAGLFEGDSTEEYQYDIYRYMRGAVLSDDPYAEAPFQDDKQRSWDQYHSITNLIWLHFILYKLLEQVDWPSATKAPPRGQKGERAEWKRANDLEHVLLRVQELLDPGVLCGDDLRSASDLVGLALRETWLDEEDVVGEGGGEGEASGLASRLEKLDVHSQPAADVREEADVNFEAAVRPRTRRKH